MIGLPNIYNGLQNHMLQQFMWFHSSDFESANTFIPTNKEIPGTNRVDSYDRGNRKFSVFKKYGGTILNASTNATRLPYPKFTAHL